ncbi:MAG: hypothetical protein ACK58T_12050 [Phycisphaerae bacterium]|jgi:hypothetical protein
MFTHPFGRAILLICALFCAGLHAQVVRLANHSSAPFSTWKRTQVYQPPPHAAGRVGDVRYVVRAVAAGWTGSRVGGTMSAMGPGWSGTGA